MAGKSLKPTLTCVYTDPYTADTGDRAGFAHSELKTRLLRGDFAFGMRLGEERLAAMMGVSRTPVREALARLHTEGLVRRHPEGGYCPVTPDLTTITELYETRFALELSALARPLTTGIDHDPAAIVALHDQWEAIRASDPDPDPDFVLLDEDFHIRLAQASGNMALTEMLGRVNERIRIVRMQDFLLPDRVSLTAIQHLGVLDAVARHDLDGARRQLVSHFAESQKVVEQRAASAIARMLVVDPAEP
jgi:DNA-binding GntR family transcriptional regulator